MCSASDGKRKYNPISCSALCLPKSESRMLIKDILKWNTTAMGKLL